jgi:hypothetical protein
VTERQKVRDRQERVIYIQKVRDSRDRKIERQGEKLTERQIERKTIIKTEIW